MPYYQRFMCSFPDIFALSAAPIQEVFKIWEGLGYYRRVENLHACSRHLVNNCQGSFPDTYQELMKLPGIGSYTAAAIASICFGQAVPSVDGNVIRVTSRYFGIGLAKGSSKLWKIVRDIHTRQMEGYSPADYNQAFMELGSRVCRFPVPLCCECVLSAGCWSYRHSDPALFPIRSPRKARKVRTLHYYLFEFEDLRGARLRQEQDIWKGLFEFHRTDSGEQLSSHQFESPNQGTLVQSDGPIRHELSHQLLRIFFHRIVHGNAGAFEETLRKYALVSYPKEQFEDLPFPIVIRKYLRSLAGN